MKNRRIDHGAALEPQAFVGQQAVDRVHHLSGQLVFLQQAAKVQGSGLLGQGVFAQLGKR